MTTDRTDRLATDDEAREVLDIAEAVTKCRAAMADLVPDAKVLVVHELHRWVTLEEATHLPEFAPARRH